MARSLPLGRSIERSFEPIRQPLRRMADSPLAYAQGSSLFFEAGPSPDHEDKSSILLRRQGGGPTLREDRPMPRLILRKWRDGLVRAFDALPLPPIHHAASERLRRGFSGMGQVVTGIPSSRSSRMASFRDGVFPPARS